MEISSHEKCLDCPGLCCRYLDIPLIFYDRSLRPQTWIDIDYLRWILLHSGKGSPIVGVVLESGVYHLRLRVACRELNAEGKCSIYSSRPFQCRAFSPEPECPKDYSGGETPAPVMLQSEKDVINHAKQWRIDLGSAPKGTFPIFGREEKAKEKEKVKKE